MITTFEHVHLHYGTGRAILDDVSFTIAPHSFHFLIGESGAGKSSLLRLIHLSERPDSGCIKLFDRDTAKIKRIDIPPLRRRLGVVFQDFRLIPHLTALENTALPLRLVGASEGQIRTHVEELLDWVGLGDRMNALPSELSGGEQQRVAIARAVVNKPALLLADEPTGSVDEDAAFRLLHLFVELNNMGTAVLLATHQAGLVERMNKPAFHLKDGKLTHTDSKGKMAA